MNKRWYSKTHVDIELQGTQFYPESGGYPGQDIRPLLPDIEGAIRSAVMRELAVLASDYRYESVEVRTGLEGGWVE